MKNCTQCKSPFEVTEEDRIFLKEVSPSYNGQIYLISEPTLCWSCKLQNRLSFRNERSLYRRQCDFSGKEIVSIYSPDKPYVVYDREVWWSDAWNPMDHGRDFDFSRPFFEQFHELMLKVPLVSLWLANPQNAEFNNNCFELKDSYMNANCDFSEQLFYSYCTEYANYSADCTFVQKGELSYESIDSEGVYHCFYSQNLTNCSEVYFSSNLMNCRYCFGCDGLRNKEYYIFNQPVTKQEWEDNMNSFHFDSLNVLKNQEMARQKNLHIPKRDSTLISCEECNGDNLYHSKNLQNCYDVRRSEDSKNVIYGAFGVKKVLDAYAVGDVSWCYEILGGGMGTHQSAFLMNPYQGPSRSYYSMQLVNGTADCFGSIGLKKAQYCILNKQYSKGDYESLLPKVIAHMQKTGEWGQFFPPSISMFGYNETKAQELFPLTQEVALRKGYQWSTYQKPAPSFEKKIPGGRLPDLISEVPDDILNWAIECEDSGELYKITKLELELYRKLNLPVPRKSPNVRHLNRMKHRNPYQLWSRQCAKCQTPIQTTYSPDRPETVYCESCYLKEIY